MMQELDFFEFLGIMIGDGCLLYYPKHRIYGIEITGNADEELEYYGRISSYLKSEYGVKSRVFVKHSPMGKCVKLVAYDKRFAEFLISCGIACNKTYSVKLLPEFEQWMFAKSIILGIFETDGCLYFSKSRKSNYPSYPRIELKTSSPALAQQLVKILSNQGFKVKSLQKARTITIYMSGEKMLYKWIDEIGFSSLKNHTKYQLWKQLGYYIPRISLCQRCRMLSCGGSQAAKIG